jgi:hypothetical protein
MKTLTIALTLTVLVAAPAFIQSAGAASPNDRRDTAQPVQGYDGTYAGYPLSEWYRSSSW